MRGVTANSASSLVYSDASHAKKDSDQRVGRTVVYPKELVAKNVAARTMAHCDAACDKMDATTQNNAPIDEYRWALRRLSEDCKKPPNERMQLLRSLTRQNTHPALGPFLKDAESWYPAAYKTWVSEDVDPNPFAKQDKINKAWELRREKASAEYTARDTADDTQKRRNSHADIKSNGEEIILPPLPRKIQKTQISTDEEAKQTQENPTKDTHAEFAARNATTLNLIDALIPDDDDDDDDDEAAPAKNDDHPSDETTNPVPIEPVTQNESVRLNPIIESDGKLPKQSDPASDYLPNRTPNEPSSSSTRYVPPQITTQSNNQTTDPSSSAAPVTTHGGDMQLQCLRQITDANAFNRAQIASALFALLIGTPQPQPAESSPQLLSQPSQQIQSVPEQMQPPNPVLQALGLSLHNNPRQTQQQAPQHPQYATAHDDSDDGGYGSEIWDVPTDDDEDQDPNMPHARRVFPEKHQKRRFEHEEERVINKCIFLNVRMIKPKHLHRISPDLRGKNPSQMKDFFKKFRKDWCIFHPATRNMTPIRGQLPHYERKTNSSKTLTPVQRLRRVEANRLYFDIARSAAITLGRPNLRRIYNMDATPVRHCYARQRSTGACLGKSTAARPVNQPTSANIVAYLSSDGKKIPRPLVVITNTFYGSVNRSKLTAKEQRRRSVEDSYKAAYWVGDELRRSSDASVLSRIKLSPPNYADGRPTESMIADEIYSMMEMERNRDEADFLILDSAPEHRFDEAFELAARQRGLFIVKIAGRTTPLCQPLDDASFALLKKEYKTNSRLGVGTLETDYAWLRAREIFREFSNEQVFAKHGFDCSVGPMALLKDDLRAVYADAFESDPIEARRTMEYYTFIRTQLFIDRPQQKAGEKPPLASQFRPELEVESAGEEE